MRWACGLDRLDSLDKSGIEHTRPSGAADDIEKKLGDVPQTEREVRYGVLQVCCPAGTAKRDLIAKENLDLSDYPMKKDTVRSFLGER